jgi:predicted HD phosphohydrolase
MSGDDFFRGPGAQQAAMRHLLEREAERIAPRLGMLRRSFLSSALAALAASAVAQQMARFRSVAEAQAGFAAPSEDCYASLRGDGQLDWTQIHSAAQRQQSAAPDSLLNMLRAATNMYGGFGVTGLTHGLQTATRAVRDGAADELVLIALVHDVGDVICPINHAEICAAFLRPYVSDGGYRVVRHHMEFQLKHYGDTVALPTDMRDRYQHEPWYPQAVQLSDAWDHVSFDPDYDTLPLSAFEPLIRAHLARTSGAPQRTAAAVDSQCG